MSWLILSCRLSGKTSRTKVDSINFKGTVASLKSNASRVLDVSVQEIGKYQEFVCKLICLILSLSHPDIELSMPMYRH